MDSPNIGTNITWLDFCSCAPFSISKFYFTINYTEYGDSYIPYWILSTYLVRITVRIMTSSGPMLAQYKFTRVFQLPHGLEELLDMKRREVKASDISFLLHLIYFTFHLSYMNVELVMYTFSIINEASVHSALVVPYCNVIG